MVRPVNFCRMGVTDTGVEQARRAAAGDASKRTYVRGIFSAIAPRYDLLNHLLSANIDRRWRRLAIERLAWRRQPEALYLDLCAGTLDVAAMLARTNGFRGTIVGADFALPMLAAGRGKAPPAVVAPVGADALALPLPTSRMAGAIVAFGIRNLADLDGGLREIGRVLAPDGRLVILEFSRPRHRAVRALYSFYFHRVLPFVGRLISGHPTAYRYLPESVEHFPVEEALASRMRDAGFVDVRWEPLTFGIAAIHVGTKRAA